MGLDSVLTRSAPAPVTAMPRRLAPVWLVFALLAETVVAYLEDFRMLVGQWSQTAGLAHGFAVAALVPLLVWWQRGRVCADGERRALAGPAIALGAAATVFARAASVDAVVACLIPVNVLLAAWAGLGLRGAAGLVFPLCYFWLGLPVTDLLTPVLQWLTVKAEALLLGLVGVNALIEGSFVTVPGGSFEIAEGCAGTHYAVIALATAGLYALLEALSWRRSVLLMAVALGIAMLANWVRVTVIILVGNATLMRSGLVTSHYWFGWCLFAVALVPFFAIARRLVTVPSVPSVAAVPAGTGGVAAVPLLAACGALLLAPAWTWVVDHLDGGAVAAPELRPVAGWVGPGPVVGDWLPSFPGAVTAQGAYRRGADEVEAFVGRYDRQSPGRKLIGYYSMIGGADWRAPTSSGMEKVATGSRDEAPWTEMLLHSRDGEARLVRSWYEVRGRRVLSPTEVKLREGLHAFGWPRRSGIVALSARCLPACDAARAALDAAYAAGLGRQDAATGAP